MRMWVQSLASLSGLRIWHCCELWCSCRRDLDFALLWLWQKKKKKKKKKKKRRRRRKKPKINFFSYYLGSFVAPILERLTILFWLSFFLTDRLILLEQLIIFQRIEEILRVKKFKIKGKNGVPVIAHQEWTQLVSMKMWVQSLACLSGLRIQCYHELWCKSQMRLGSCVAVAVL